MNRVSDNLARVNERIDAACKRAGRAREDVRLVAVTKTHAPKVIQAAIDAGHTLFGESYVQEFLEKKEALPSDIEWHYIGRLQSNKIKYLVGQVGLIHSIDRLKLLKELEKRAAKAGVVQRCLIEVNVGEEATKGGAAERELFELLQKAAAFRHIEVLGLMSIPPFLDDPEAIRPYHKRLFSLREKAKKETGLSLPQLSMGMSNDFEQAIEEGATMVRVGTDIFGERVYR